MVDVPLFMFCTEALYPLGLLCYYLCVSYKHGALNLYGARIDCKSIVSIGSVGSTPTLPTMKKKRTLREIFIPVNVYDSQVIVLIGHTKEEVLKWIDKNVEDDVKESAKGIVDVQSYTRARTACLHGGGSIIWIIKENKPVLIHELFHSTAYMLREKGIPLTQESEEAYAYLLGYLTQSCNI